VLYQLFAYTLPFEGETTAAALLKIIHDPPTPLDKFVTGYPKELDSILTRALAKNREDRYRSADEFSMDLLQIHEQLKQETVSQHLLDAEGLLEKGDLNRARDRLLQLLKLEQKHTRAITLLRHVQQKLEKEHGGEQARQLKARAEESYSQGEFEAALHYLNQAIALDTSNPELPKFIQQVREAKIKSEELRQALSLRMSAEIWMQRGRPRTKPSKSTEMTRRRKPLSNHSPRLGREGKTAPVGLAVGSGAQGDQGTESYRCAQHSQASPPPGPARSSSAYAGR
jgi:serine/threonine protein kinase